jgi:hypothetical protein
MIRLSLILALLLTPAICFAQTVTSPGPLVIVTDDDGNGDDGQIDFQKGFPGATVFKLTNTGNAIVINNLGINTPNPVVPLQITVTYPPKETASQEMIRFTPPNDHDPFQFYHRSTIFGNDLTNSVGWGFGPAGDVQGSPSFAFLMEDSFGTPPEAQWELHLQIAPTEAPVYRPWTWTIHRRTGAAEVVQTARSHFYSGANQLHVTNDELLAIGAMRVQGNSFIFETTENGGASAKQLRILPHPSDAASSWLVFGDTASGVSLGKSAQGIAFYRGGTSLDAGELHSYRYFAYGPTFGGAPLTMIGDRVALAAGRSVSFSSTASAEGGADVTITRTGVGVLQIENPITGLGAEIRAKSYNTNGGGSFKINGTKVVGAPCPAIPNSNGTTGDNKRAINALLTCMRSHGLVGP